MPANLPENPTFLRETEGPFSVGEIVVSKMARSIKDAYAHYQARIVTEIYFGASTPPERFIGATFSGTTYSGTGADMALVSLGSTEIIDRFNPTGVVIPESQFVYMVMERSILTGHNRSAGVLIDSFHEQLIAEKIARRERVSGNERAIDRARRFRCLRRALQEDPDSGPLYYKVPK